MIYSLNPNIKSFERIDRPNYFSRLGLKILGRESYVAKKVNELENWPHGNQVVGRTSLKKPSRKTEQGD